MFERGEFDVCKLVFSEFENVMKPDEAGILRVLLPRNINTQVFTALLENQAGEMGSKMAAMDNATRNQPNYWRGC